VQEGDTTLAREQNSQRVDTVPLGSDNRAACGNGDTGAIKASLGGQRTLVTIVVPVFNSQIDLNLFVKSVESSEYKRLEIVVVDDASTVPIRVPATSVPVRLIRNPVNRGKAYSVNRGAELGAGDILVISDPDVEPDSGLFQCWVNAFEADDRLGVAGAYVYYSYDRNRLTHAGALVTGRLHFVLRRLTDRIDEGLSQKEFRSPNLALDDIYAVRRNLWVRAGGFDDVTFDTMFEDVDLQLRLSRLGCTIAIIANARAFHRQGSRTATPFSTAWADRVLRGFKFTALPRNRLLFLRKHGWAHGWTLAAHGSLLVAFYGGYAILSGASIRSRASQCLRVMRAVSDGIHRPLDPSLTQAQSGAGSR
jgi:N-acetylglucosaminyl-diphospho-decaprenol L-rhamnosyltransferase